MGWFPVTAASSRSGRSTGCGLSHPGAVKGTAKVKIGGGSEVNTSITNEAVEELGLAIG